MNNQRIRQVIADAIASEYHDRAGVWMRYGEECADRVLAELRQAEPDHFVNFDADGWFIEHSMGCRLDGTIGTCAYNRSIREVYDEPPTEDEWGRWRITNIDSEGLPSLVLDRRGGGEATTTEGSG